MTNMKNLKWIPIPLALFEENLEDAILPQKRAEWNQLRSKGCNDNFTANATDNFFHGFTIYHIPCFRPPKKFSASY